MPCDVDEKQTAQEIEDDGLPMLSTTEGEETWGKSRKIRVYYLRVYLLFTPQPFHALLVCLCGLLEDF